MLVCFSTPLCAQNFEVSSNCEAAYDAIIELRFEDAQQWIETEKRENPTNSLVILLENYPELFVAYFDEQETDFQTYKQHAKQRLDALSSADSDSPYFRYAKAEIKMQTGILRLKFGEYITAMREMKSAYSLLKKNKELHPEFKPNLKNLGIIHALVGTVPDSYKWLLKILGLHGSVKQGLTELEEFTNQPKQIFQREATTIYAFLLIYTDTQYEESRQLIENRLTPHKSGLDNLVASTIYYRLGECDKGIEVLQSKPRGQNYFELHLLDFMLGSLKLNKQDEDANLYLSAFLDNFNGRHYVKSAQQQLAWCQLLKNDTEGYKKQMQLITMRGADLLDCDKKADKEALSESIPNVYLLKAQLLFDGGYYPKALEVLQAITDQDLHGDAENLEYTYRLARIYEGLQEQENAIYFYEKTIELGSNSLAYFGPKSALQMGIIYERDGKKTEASYWYKKAIELPAKNYKNSIEQQAKAGLSRLKE